MPAPSRLPRRLARLRRYATRPLGTMRRLLAPVGFSLVAHVTLGGLITLIALNVSSSPEPPPPPGPPVTITLRNPAPPSEPEPTDPARESTAPAPSPAPPALPEDDTPPLPPLAGLPTPGLPVQAPPEDPGSSADELERPSPTATGAVFAGVRAAGASRIVYAVDVSGAMVSSLPFVIAELKRSVDRLMPGQQFQVVLFRDPPPGSPLLPVVHFSPDAGDPARLHDPLPATRARLTRWLDAIRPAGRSNPIVGLRAALALRPEVVFLLARSIPRSGDEADRAWGGGPGQVLAELERLNPPHPDSGHRPVTIKTIQFLSDDPAGVMQAIAERHGGGADAYTLLTLDELDAR